MTMSFTMMLRTCKRLRSREKKNCKRRIGCSSRIENEDADGVQLCLLVLGAWMILRIMARVALIRKTTLRERREVSSKA
jgi:hypothetical protein